MYENNHQHVLFSESLWLPKRSKFSPSRAECAQCSRRCQVPMIADQGLSIPSFSQIFVIIFTTKAVFNLEIREIGGQQLKPQKNIPPLIGQTSSDSVQLQAPSPGLKSSVRIPDVLPWITRGVNMRMGLFILDVPRRFLRYSIYNQLASRVGNDMGHDEFLWDQWDMIWSSNAIHPILGIRKKKTVNKSL